MNSPTPPKGSLEDLFRHHLLESEAAAVPPRPHVWEQLDNSLLLAQNEQYRRRLRVHRWAVAASLLLAMLAGGGWWHSQQPAASPSLAQATRTGADALGVAVRPGYRAASPAGSQASGLAASPQAYGVLAASASAPAAGAVSSPSPSIALAIDQTATSSSLSAPTSLTFASGAGARRPGSLAGAGAAKRYGRPAARLASLAYESAETSAARRAHAYHSQSPTATSPSQLAAASAGTPSSLAAASYLAATDQPARTAFVGGDAATDLAEVSEQFMPAQEATAALAARTAQLDLAAGPGLPSSLTSLPQPELPAPTIARHWQYGLAYAASSFEPNIDFTKESSSYNQALGVASARVTQSAAAEYRSHLRAGLGQRLSLWAARRLGNGRFSLRTGLELAQNMAYSASSVAFVGEQVPDLSYSSSYSSYSQALPSPLRSTSYRYRTASVPVELHYGNPAKPGFSFYSRVGGLLTALLNVRSEVEGNAEATRTYSLTSGSTPYRHLSASLRGGAGVQYRPVGHQWGLTLGPMAEAGILSLNADPIQDFWSQKRPYSFGLEAGVELGRTPHTP